LRDPSLCSGFRQQALAPPTLANRLKLLPPILLVFALQTFVPLQLPAVAPSAGRKHRQYRQRRQPEFLIVDRDPRQNHQHRERAQRYPQPLHSRSWCTGEDSNLRSPLGAADLQSAAINHSATCAHPAEHKHRPEPLILLSKNRRQAPGNIPLTSRAAVVARIPFSEAAAGFSSLGELCVLLGLLLLPHVARSR